MSRKPRLLLLDAGAVFAAMKHDAWDALVTTYEVVLPATVIRDEVIFYRDLEGRRHEIDLLQEVSAGRIREVAMDAAAVAELKACFSPEFRERLDEGELEAIAYLLSNDAQDLRFVSADGPAIEAVAMVDPDLRAISLEEALDFCGRTKPIERRFSREFTKAKLESGSMRRIQGRGLVG